MRRLNILLSLFGITLLILLGWLILQTYASLKQEEISQLKFFAAELFTQMEADLAAKIYREEVRTVDAYQIGPDSPLKANLTGKKSDPSTVSPPPGEAYVLGYFQNNPDGSFKSPYSPPFSDTAKGRAVIERLKSVNTVFNRKKYFLSEPPKTAPKSILSAKEAEKTESFAEKFFISKSRNPSQKSYLGRRQKRTEEITTSQAVKLLQKKMTPESRADIKTGAAANSADASPAGQSAVAAPSAGREAEANPMAPGAQAPSSPAEIKPLKVEVTPFQAVGIDPDTLFIFRRVILENQVYRQGFVLTLTAFMQHLADAFFLPQPMAEFTQLTMTAFAGDSNQNKAQFGPNVQKHKFRLTQTFPVPFDFLTASLTCRDIPASPARQTFTWIVAMLIVVVLIGFFSIYQAVRSVVELSERRSRFVSSVTHELKTPLTNINLYIEMLEQGMAQDRAKELAYYQILSSESARLSRLIGSVLELSCLEKKQRSFNLQTGMFADVLDEIQTLFRARLRQEDYSLAVKSKPARPFVYDREVMIQVLTNLIENSLKFCQNADRREIHIDIKQTEKQTSIAISDYGPGISSKSLKKIFDDFYRGTDSNSQAIPGTGIGLALVKRYIIAMGGQVTARNRTRGTGCTILISLPS